MIAKNENPLPVTYSCYNSQVQLTNEELLNKVNFKIFYDLVCLTSKSLALVTGTKSTFDLLHILNLKIENFNESTGEPNEEMSKILSWY